MVGLGKFWSAQKHQFGTFYMLTGSLVSADTITIICERSNLESLGYSHGRDGARITPL